MKLNRLTRFITNHSQMVTLVSVATGVATTAVAAGKGHAAAQEVMKELPEESTFLDKAKATWKYYVPACLAGISTVAALGWVAALVKGRADDMETLYFITDKAYRSYRTAAEKQLSPKKAEAVRKEIAEEGIAKNPKPTTLIVTGDECICYDSYSDRYFKSNMETIKAAVNTVNHKIITEMYASLTDFYDEVGLPETAVSGYVGWNTDALMEVTYSSILSDDGKPVLAIDFCANPLNGYDHLV